MSKKVAENIASVRMPPAATVAIVIAAIMLSSAAFFNGFPLVAGDTGAYISDAIPFLKSFELNWVRPVFYSLFILPLHLRISLWPIVLVQGLIVAHFLWITLRITNSKQSISVISFLIVILILTGFTSLPWLVGQIMADVFTSIVILGLFLLGFALDRLTRFEKVYIFFLTTGAISFHLSHLPLALGLVIVTIVLHGFLEWHGRFGMKGLALLFGPLLLAASALLVANMAGSGQITLSPGTPIVVLAKLIDDGTAKTYLHERCPEKGYMLCSYRAELSSSHDFLFGQNSPLKKAGGPQVLRAEAGEIVWGSLRAYPVKQFKKSFFNFSKQFVNVSTGASLSPRGEGSWTNRVIRNVFGSSVHSRYALSMQNTGKLPIVTFEWIHNMAIIAAIPIVVFVFVILVRRKDSLYVSLFILILFGLIGNAFITGVLSDVYSRYQSRVIWLIVFYGIVGSLRVFRDSSLPSYHLASVVLWLRARTS